MLLRSYNKCLVAILAVTVLIVAGCSGKQDKDKMVFHYNNAEGLESLDPAFAKNQTIWWACHQLYNTLVETDSNLNIRPSLAKSWDISDDGAVFTFHLRTDVYFHNNEAFPGGKGRRMTAQDVVYSFKRVMDPKTASSGAWIFNDKVNPDAGFIALNDSTFQLRLMHPFHPILGILTMPYCSIVPHEVVEKYGKDFGRHPCGTGPFLFKSWDEGQALIMLKNPTYFEFDSSGQRLPYLDAIKVTFITSKATEFLLFLQGELDFIKDVDASYKDEILTKAGTLKKEFQGKVILKVSPYLNTEYLGFLMDSSLAVMKNSPVRFKKVRQAINYGIDRAKIITYLNNNIGTPAHSGFVPLGLPSFDSTAVKGYYYDPDKARELLAEAGYPDGKGLPVITLHSTEQYADIANFAASELQEIGINIQVDIQQIGMLRQMAAKSQLPFFRAQWMADYPDAEDFLAMYYSKNPAPPNYTRFKNPLYDQLYEKSLSENNDSIRYQLYHRMDNMIVADAPVVTLYYDKVVRFIHPWVKNFPNNALNLLELRRVKIAPH